MHLGTVDQKYGNSNGIVQIMHEYRLDFANAWLRSGVVKSLKQLFIIRIRRRRVHAR